MTPPSETRHPAEDLHQFAWVVINSSAGKDSQTALRQAILEADRQGFPREQMVVSHQCLGKYEWPGTKELAETQARHYGLRFLVSQYNDKGGKQKTLLDYVRERGKWPDSKNRFCTSEFKRGPGRRVVTQLSRERPGKVLQVFGFRAEESPARAKKIPFAHNPRFSSKQREVWDWLPIHTWDEETVWRDIRASGVPYHPAYDLGMNRLSCCFCIFSPFNALLIAGKANPSLLDEYCELEAEIGHTFQHNKPIAAVRAALAAGMEPKRVTEKWNM